MPAPHAFRIGRDLGCSGRTAATKGRRARAAVQSSRAPPAGRMLQERLMMAARQRQVARTATRAPQTNPRTGPPPVKWLCRCTLTDRGALLCGTDAEAETAAVWHQSNIMCTLTRGPPCENTVDICRAGRSCHKCLPTIYLAVPPSGVASSEARLCRWLGMKCIT